MSATAIVPPQALITTTTICHVMFCCALGSDRGGGGWARTSADHWNPDRFALFSVHCAALVLLLMLDVLCLVPGDVAKRGESYLTASYVKWLEVSMCVVPCLRVCVCVCVYVHTCQSVVPSSFCCCARSRSCPAPP